MKKPYQRPLTEEMKAELAQRSERLAHLLIQAECELTTLAGQTYIAVPSMNEDLLPGAVNMINVTDDIESFMWTGKPSAKEIVAKALNAAAEKDKRA